jgi:DNA-binding XRE family transcriptional regulator
MHLKEYLNRFCILPTHMAKAMNVFHNVIFRIIRDGNLPSLAIALKIEDFTEGAVTCRDIYKECMLIKEQKEKKN